MCVFVLYPSKIRLSPFPFGFPFNSNKKDFQPEFSTHLPSPELVPPFYCFAFLGVPLVFQNRAKNKAFFAGVKLIFPAKLQRAHRAHGISERPPFLFSERRESQEGLKRRIHLPEKKQKARPTTRRLHSLFFSLPEFPDCSRNLGRPF